MGHKEIAEQLLHQSDPFLLPHPSAADGRPIVWPSYLTHAILALVETLEDFSIAFGEEEEEDE